MEILENFIAKCEKKSVLDNSINTNDSPELIKKDFERGYLKNQCSSKLIKVEIDSDLLEGLSEDGKINDKKINDVLRWARMNGYSFKDSQ